MVDIIFALVEEPEFKEIFVPLTLKLRVVVSLPDLLVFHFPVHNKMHGLMHFTKLYFLLIMFIEFLKTTYKMRIYLGVFQI